MADFANKRCPLCGKRPIDRRLVQCPDCRVPFLYEQEPAPALTPAQMRDVARQMLGSWKLWAGLAVPVILLIGAAVWGMQKLAASSLDRQTRETSASLEQWKTNHLAELSRHISTEISNQVAAEFSQPRIRSTIEQVAVERSGDVLTNSVWPSLQAFREGLKQASAELARATNDLAALSNSVKAAQGAVAQITAAASAETAYLRLVNNTVTRDGTNYVLTVFLKSSTGRPVGLVDMMAGTYRQTAKIVSFTARNVEQTEPLVVNDVADAARMKFNAARADTPVILELVLTGPTIVKIVSDSQEEELTLPVAIDKLQLPVGSR